MNNIFKQIMVIVFSTTLFCCGGGDEEDTMDMPNYGEENDDQVGDKDDPIKNGITSYVPCMEWGKSSASIKQKMSDYTFMSEASYSDFPNNDCLVFASKDKNCIVSYGFMHDKLYVTNLFVRYDFASSSEIASLFTSYTKTNADDGEFYLNKSTNTLGNIETVSLDGCDYKSISWCDYNLEALENKQAVDLGLSVKWATCNVGAQLPEERGNYYAWGEVATKESYNYITYQFYESGKYIDIGTDISGTEYDAARQEWGGSWRMPTKKELIELMEKCTWSALYTYGGTHPDNGGEFPYNGGEFFGFLVTGPNNNKIFIPANDEKYGTGYYCLCGVEHEHDFHTVSLWGSNIGNDDYTGTVLFCNMHHENLVFMANWLRIDGLGIRPVIDK